MSERIAVLLCVGSSLVVTPLLSAQVHTVEQHEVAFVLDSGPLENPGHEEVLVFDDVVEGPRVPWMRLHFSEVVLKPGSYLLITSLRDGATQYLDGVSAAQWYNHSAYFNGNAVQVSMYAGPNTAGNRVQIDRLIVGEWGPGDVEETQCGPTDDRVASDEPERARLLNIGCTASIYTTDSCFITAGHCVQTLANTVQFNVPPSLPNGTLQHPGPEDQYSVDQSSRVFTNGGVGNDWGLFRVFVNSTTGLMPYEVQGAHLSLATALPALPETVDLVGYGVDSGDDNQTQQRSVGPIVSYTGLPNNPAVNHQADTQGGNSGSAILDENFEVIAIHTHGGCTTGGGSNASTGITHPNLQNALATYCPDGGGGIPCSDVRGMRVRCRQDGRVQVRVVFTDSSHSGETITIALNGSPVDVAIVGRRASYSQPGFSGPVEVSLVEPAGCVDDMIANCP